MLYFYGNKKLMSIKSQNGIEISPSGYLFNTETGESFVLNATGAEILSI